MFFDNLCQTVNHQSKVMWIIVQVCLAQVVVGYLMCEMSIGLAFLFLVLSYWLHWTVYQCKTFKNSPLLTFGCNYSVLQEDDIHGGDTVYTK